eukprot:1156647-Pelagomonas_calceolata.AAC.9
MHPFMCRQGYTKLMLHIVTSYPSLDSSHYCAIAWKHTCKAYSNLFPGWAWACAGGSGEVTIYVKRSILTRACEHNNKQRLHATLEHSSRQMTASNVLGEGVRLEACEHNNKQRLHATLEHSRRQMTASDFLGEGLRLEACEHNNKQRLRATHEHSRRQMTASNILGEGLRLEACEHTNKQRLRATHEHSRRQMTASNFLG